MIPSINTSATPLCSDASDRSPPRAPPPRPSTSAPTSATPGRKQSAENRRGEAVDRQRHVRVERHRLQRRQQHAGQAAQPPPTPNATRPMRVARRCPQPRRARIARARAQPATEVRCGRRTTPARRRLPPSPHDHEQVLRLHRPPANIQVPLSSRRRLADRPRCRISMRVRADPQAQRDDQARQRRGARCRPRRHEADRHPGQRSRPAPPAPPPRRAADPELNRLYASIPASTENTPWAKFTTRVTR